MIGLTRKQAECFDFMTQRKQETGIMPTLQEISDHLGYNSKSRVYGLLESMQERGVIRRLPGKARAVEIVGADPTTLTFLSPDVRAFLNGYAKAHDTSPETIIAERMREWAEHEKRGAA